MYIAAALRHSNLQQSSSCTQSVGFCVNKKRHFSPNRLQLKIRLVRKDCPHAALSHYAVPHRRIMLRHTVALCCAAPSHYAVPHCRIMLCRSLSGVEVTAFCMWLYLQFRDLSGKTPSFACAKLESQVCKGAVLGRCTMKDCRVTPDNDTGHTPGNDSYAMFGGFDSAQPPGLSCRFLYCMGCLFLFHKNRQPL